MSLSQTRFLGLPLVHVATGHMENGRYVRGVARGWIAIGDIAFGPVAVGAVAVGGISLGGMALGVVSLAGVATGIFPLGGLAVGYAALGGAAVGWHAALGGLAVARDFALGGAAFAREANTEAARRLFAEDGFFRIGTPLMNHSRWLILLAVLPAVNALVRRIRGA